jgi:hypothetical protein
MNTVETMHNVTIDVATQVYDNDQQRVVGENRENVFDKRISGTTKLVCVLKAFESVRANSKVKGNLNNLEVQVDGVNFPG